MRLAKETLQYLSGLVVTIHEIKNRWLFQLTTETAATIALWVVDLVIPGDFAEDLAAAMYAVVAAYDDLIALQGDAGRIMAELRAEWQNFNSLFAVWQRRAEVKSLLQQFLQKPSDVGAAEFVELYSEPVFRDFVALLAIAGKFLHAVPRRETYRVYIPVAELIETGSDAGTLRLPILSPAYTDPAADWFVDAHHTVGWFLSDAMYRMDRARRALTPDDKTRTFVNMREKLGSGLEVVWPGRGLRRRCMLSRTGLRQPG